MSVYDPALSQQRGVSYALVPGEEQLVFVASSPEMLTRVLILHLVAQLRPSECTPAQLQRIRVALQAQEWEEAIVAWIDATERKLNIFSDEPVWTEDALEHDRFALELPLSPIFEDVSVDAR